MRRPPAVTLWPRYPVTAVTALLAIIATLAWWDGKEVSFLLCSFEVSQGEVWRLVTTALLHVDVIHLGFNLYWLWVFSTCLESVFGHWRSLAVLLLFAITSSSAEYTLAEGGVGLSGIAYGLFGLLWILSRRDQRFANTVDGQTIVLFVAWFFICIALTKANVMAIGNVAHGAGFITGLLLGASIVLRGELRKFAVSALFGFVVLCLMGAFVLRPYVNRVADIASELAHVGYLELEQGRNERAVLHFRQALDRNDRQATWWYDLGVAYARLGRAQEAVDAFQRAVDLQPSKEFRKALDDWKVYLERKKAFP
jgi:GlpG protein